MIADPTLLGTSGDVRLSFNIISDISQLLTYHFMVNALIAGTVVAVSASVVGWFMVLRRQTFAGHTLAVIGFPGAAGATLLGIGIEPGYFAACIAGAAIIGVLPRARSGGTRISESAVIGTLQAFALASGVLFVNLSHGFLNSTTALLFGSFLGITNTQVLVLSGVCGAVLIVMAVIGRPLLFSSVDADVADVLGIPVRWCSIAFLILLGGAVAQASTMTGSLLVFALLVMPSSAAQHLTANPARSLVLSIVIGVAITWLGLAAAYFSPYPVGFCLTAFGFAAYLAAIGIEHAHDTWTSAHGIRRSVA